MRKPRLGARIRVHIYIIRMCVGLAKRAGHAIRGRAVRLNESRGSGLNPARIFSPLSPRRSRASRGWLFALFPKKYAPRGFIGPLGIRGKKR